MQARKRKSSAKYFVDTKKSFDIDEDVTKPLLELQQLVNNGAEKSGIEKKLSEVLVGLNDAQNKIGIKEVWFMGPYGGEPDEDRATLQIALEVVQSNLSEIASLNRNWLRGDETSELAMIGSYGLAGDLPRPKEAKILLEEFKARLARQFAKPLRIQMLNDLAKIAALPFLLCSIVATLPFLTDSKSVILLQVSGYSSAITGSILGLVLASAFRSDEWSFDDIKRLMLGGAVSLLRILAVSLLAVAISVLCNLNVVELSIGTLKTTKLAWNPGLSFVVGIFIGFSDKLFFNLLAGQSESAVKKTK